MLENLKRKVVQIAVNAENSGLCKNKSGNFSLRDFKTGFVLITPSGVSRQEFSYKDILVVDIEGNIIDVETKVRPTTELTMHLQVYKYRDDAFLKACYVEDVAEIYYRSIIINGGKEPKVIPEEEFAAVLETKQKDINLHSLCIFALVS